jgi:hypothetical protein
MAAMTADPPMTFEQALDEIDKMDTTSQTWVLTEFRFIAAGYNDVRDALIYAVWKALNRQMVVTHD